jgi:hypothetical protein
MGICKVGFQADEEHVDDVYMYRLAVEALRAGKHIETK